MRLLENASQKKRENFTEHIFRILPENVGEGTKGIKR